MYEKDDGNKQNPVVFVFLKNILSSFNDINILNAHRYYGYMPFTLVDLLCPFESWSL